MDEVPPVLVVDDEPLIRLMIADALQEGGYSVVEAADGHTAIRQIDACAEFRGIVCDVRLGSGPNGWDVARHARVKFPALAIVYVTGDSAGEWSAEGVPQSAVLQKPFTSAELVTALANLLVTQ